MPGPGRRSTLSKGAHLVLDRDGGWDAAVTIPIDRTRVVVRASPGRGLLLLGTTDAPFERRRAHDRGDRAEETQILEEAGLALDAERCARRRSARASPALRVLPAGRRLDRRGRTARRRSPRGPLGMVSVAGGKLTTYRRIALAVLAPLRAELELHRIDRTPTARCRAPPIPTSRPTPSGVGTRSSISRSRRTWRGPTAALAEEVLARRALLEPLGDGLLEVEAQVLYARDREWAVSVEDVPASPNDARGHRTGLGRGPPSGRGVCSAS